MADVTAPRPVGRRWVPAPLFRTAPAVAVLGPACAADRIAALVEA